jgi:hypothetical protein
MMRHHKGCAQDFKIGGSGPMVLKTNDIKEAYNWRCFTDLAESKARYAHAYKYFASTTKTVTVFKYSWEKVIG